MIMLGTCQKMYDSFYDDSARVWPDSERLRAQNDGYLMLFHSPEEQEFMKCLIPEWNPLSTSL